MTSFDKREEAFEQQFAHDEELKFKATARRNKLLGLWAAEKLGRSGAEAEAYAKEVVVTALEKTADHDVFGKIRRDFDANGVNVSDHQIRRTMDELMARARSSRSRRGGPSAVTSTQPGFSLACRRRRLAAVRDAQLRFVGFPTHGIAFGLRSSSAAKPLFRLGNSMRAFIMRSLLAAAIFLWASTTMVVAEVNSGNFYLSACKSFLAAPKAPLPTAADAAHQGQCVGFVQALLSLGSYLPPEWRSCPPREATIARAYWSLLLS